MMGLKRGVNLKSEKEKGSRHPKRIEIMPFPVVSHRMEQERIKFLVTNACVKGIKNSKFKVAYPLL